MYGISHFNFDAVFSSLCSTCTPVNQSQEPSHKLNPFAFYTVDGRDNTPITRKTSIQITDQYNTTHRLSCNTQSNTNFRLLSIRIQVGHFAGSIASLTFKILHNSVFTDPHPHPFVSFHHRIPNPGNATSSSTCILSTSRNTTRCLLTVFIYFAVHGCFGKQATPQTA